MIETIIENNQYILAYQSYRVMNNVRYGYCISIQNFISIKQTQDEYQLIEESN